MSQEADKNQNNMVEDEDINIQEEKQINEEYKIWRKNSPFLYDLLITHALEWPSLTVQWFPDIERPENKDYTVQRLLLGTHTSSNEQNYLQIATVQIPRTDIDVAGRLENGPGGARDQEGGYGVECKINITQRIVHDGEINRARYMPQNPDIIATKTVVENGAVFIFDRTKHTSMGVEKTSRPELRLVGHKKEGYGISWNQHEKGHLISASEDGSICMWDINANTVEENRVLQALRIFNTEQVVEDVDWHPKHSYMFASVGDDRRLMLWDTRESSNNTASKSVLAHSSEVNCVKFNPKSEYLVATGSTDTTIALWDIRKISSKLHTLETHTGEILQLEWMSSTQPTASPTILASSSGDRRVNVWDISRIGDEQSVEDAADGPPELLFVHGGHTSRVCDISWNFNEPWTMCSVAEDNVVQVWQMSSNIYGGGDQLVEDRMVTDDQ